MFDKQRAEQARAFSEAVEDLRPPPMMTGEERALALARMDALASMVEAAHAAWRSRDPVFIGVMRIKNEGRWIGRVIEGMLQICPTVYVFDDHSTDDTRRVCRRFPQVKLYQSPFEGLDESRDKQWILDRVFDDLPPEEINEDSRYWAVALDGDEILTESGAAELRRAVADGGHVYSVRIFYLWDGDDRIRVDGVYGNFRRPSVFRLMNREFRYQRTPFGNGANFHCSSIPQELLGHAAPCSAGVLHLGYRDKADRLKKFEWYTRIDPNNQAEDRYLHMVMGDLPNVPADQKRLHAGPLKVVPFAP